MTTQKIYSLNKPEVLLHQIYRNKSISGREDISDPEEFLQVGFLNLNKGTRFRPHQHIWKPAMNEQTITQEAWVVISGSVKVFYYDTTGEFITASFLSAGDCSITYQGGHTYEILEDNTRVYEFKTGPYLGQALDKTFIE
jgi:cupin fold WbuC family metalloprotein